MVCRVCDRKANCTFHQSNNHDRGHRNTNLQYGKPFIIIDPSTLEKQEVMLTPAERDNKDYIEVTQAIATCSYCHKFRTSTVYTIKRKKNSTNKQCCVDCFNSGVVTEREIIEGLYD